MAWNGAGVFSRIYNWVNDANAAIAITASRMDGEDDGFATGLNNCLTKNGENSPTANLPMATYKHTGVGNAAARNQYLAAGQQQDNDCIYGVASGTDTYTLTPTPAITAYVAGQEFIVKFTNANTGAATLNVSSVGAKDITKGVSTALVAGDIVAAQLYRCRYDGTRFVLVGRELNATATTSGIVELATDAETVTGTDNVRATTPANITAKMAAPGAIGGTTPAAVTCTTLHATGATTLDGAVTLGDASGDTVTINGTLAGRFTLCKSTADQTVANTTLTNATSVVFPLASGNYYHFKFVLRFESTIAASGVKIGLTTPSFATRDYSAAVSIYANTVDPAASFSFEGGLYASGDSVALATLLNPNIAFTAIIEGTIKTSSAADLQVQFANSSGVATLTLHEGSCGFLTLL